MKSKLFALFYVILYGLHPAPAQHVPAGESTVVGGVLVDLFGSYWMYNEPQRSELPIRISVEYLDEKKKPTLYAYKMKTDENGYFKIENAPSGKYVLKGIELHVGQSTHITTASKYGRWAKGEQYRYWGLLSGMMYRNEKYLIETIFENEFESGIIDLGITHLSIKINERLGGTPFKNYSPNGMPPWVRMSLIQGVSRIADLNMVEYQIREEIAELKMQEKDVMVTMISPRQYFNLKF